MAASKPKLVIVGAGFGGLTLAQALADRADVKLVDGCAPGSLHAGSGKQHLRVD